MEKVENYLPRITAATPIEGRGQKMKMAKKSIASIRTDGEVRRMSREQYVNDPRQPIASPQVTAIEFQTISQANNYR